MTLSVLTLNLWHDWGPYAERAKLIREWIERLDPDLVGFQEAVRGEGFDQTAELLAGRGYHLDYVRASDYRLHDRPFEFGNAVASRWPITDRETERLPASVDGGAGDAETRAVVSVTLEAPFGPVGFTCTHLNWKFRHGAVRERQVAAVCDLALRRRPKEGFPPIVVGDFNTEPDSAEIRYVTGHQSQGGKSIALLDAWRVAGDGGPGVTWSNRNPYTHEGLEPDRRLDYVFTGFPRRDGVGRIIACRVVCDDEKGGFWPSDHFGVYAELATEPIPGREGQWGLVGGDDVDDWR